MLVFWLILVFLVAFCISRYFGIFCFVFLVASGVFRHFQLILVYFVYHVALNFIKDIASCTEVSWSTVSCTVKDTWRQLGWWPKPIYTLLDPADIADGIVLNNTLHFLHMQASQCIMLHSLSIMCYTHYAQKTLLFAQQVHTCKSAILSDKGSQRVGIGGFTRLLPCNYTQLLSIHTAQRVTALQNFTFHCITLHYITLNN